MRAQRRRVEPLTAPSRQDDGTYRITLIADDSQWVEWDPRVGFHRADREERPTP